MRFSAKVGIMKPNYPLCIILNISITYYLSNFYDILNKV